MIYITECTQNGCSDRSVSREPSGYTSFLVLLTYFVALFHFAQKAQKTCTFSRATRRWTREIRPAVRSRTLFTQNVENWKRREPSETRAIQRRVKVSSQTMSFFLVFSSVLRLSSKFNWSGKKQSTKCYGRSNFITFVGNIFFFFLSSAAVAIDEGINRAAPARIEGSSTENGYVDVAKQRR